jgi:hypothetical protein
VSSAKIRKMFWFDYDLQKQESWLNEMAAEGRNPIPSLNWLGLPSYRLEPGRPGEWVYRIELLSKDAKKPASRDYLAFVSESGVETVLVTARIAYFRKRTADGPFEIYSDTDSRIAYQRRMLKSLNWLIASEMYTILVGAVFVIPTQPFPWFAPFMGTLMVLMVPGIVMTVRKRMRVSAAIGELESQRQVFE